MEDRQTGARDPERTRAAVLDAAERLFALKGYDAVSLLEIGREAGVSRGTPSYFFGSKKGLYRAVVERMVEDVKSFIGRARSGGTSGGSIEEAMAGRAGAYIDFLAARPNFVRLIEREVLDGGRLSDEKTGLPSLAESLGDPGVEGLAGDLRRGPFRDVDAGQLTISIVALCFFPFAHERGLLAQIGADPWDREFIEARKRHVVALILHGILAPERKGES